MISATLRLKTLVVILSVFLYSPENGYPDSFIQSTFGTVPNVLKRNRPAEVKLHLYTADGSPVAGAFVEIKAKGGYFEENGDDTVVGTTDADGNYRTKYIHSDADCGSASRLKANFRKGGLQGHGHVFPEVSCE